MMRSEPAREIGLLPSQYAAIAAFRYELRRFLAFSETAATAAGLPPSPPQALLAIAGHIGAEPPSVGTIAEQLFIAPNTAAEVVARMVDAALVTKASSCHDRRRMELTLTEKAFALLDRLTAVHLEELEILEPVLRRAIGPRRSRRVS
jgi:DNA-binding MarR family transcriptional regulator